MAVFGRLFPIQPSAHHFSRALSAHTCTIELTPSLLPTGCTELRVSTSQPRSWGTIVAFPFRIFFLSTALWASLAVPLWIVIYRGLWTPNFPVAPVTWHAHEMLYGFLLPAVAGFLLTAVCVWTKTERTHGWALALMWGTWLIGRAAMFMGGSWPMAVVIGLNLLFPLWIFFDAGKRILLRRQRRHLPILLILLTLMAMQAGFLWSQGSPAFSDASLLLIAALMLVVGGRITPAFSRNWLTRQGRQDDAERIQSVPLLDKTLAAVCVGLLLTTLLRLSPSVADSPVYPLALSAFAVSAASLSTLRLWLWRGWLIREEALLWVLHLALAWIPISLLLYAASSLGIVSNILWVHALGVAAIGGLIHGVMARVVLGHTGRPLVLPKGMVWAFYSIQCAAVVRLVIEIPALAPYRQAGLDLSSAFWAFAFLLFLFRYTPMLFAPRIDGKVG